MMEILRKEVELFYFLTGIILRFGRCLWQSQLLKKGFPIKFRKFLKAAFLQYLPCSFFKKIIVKNLIPSLKNMQFPPLHMLLLS